MCYAKTVVVYSYLVLKAGGMYRKANARDYYLFILLLLFACSL